MGLGEFQRILTIPAAPPPTMTTFFFLPFFSKSSADMVRMIAARESAGDEAKTRDCCRWGAAGECECEAGYGHAHGEDADDGKGLRHVCHF